MSDTLQRKLAEAVLFLLRAESGRANAAYCRCVMSIHDELKALADQRPRGCSRFGHEQHCPEYVSWT